MASVPLDQMCPEDCNELGEPEILPRIGDEYQAQLPPPIVEPNYTDFLKNSLPIPMKWINSAKDATPQTVSGSDSKDVNETGPCSNGEENEALFLVPELLSESWSDAEKDSFVLGLYVFDKNFVEVRRFVESKPMGATLCFYYGKFYGSDEYRRWSECRKAKSKKCVYGPRIFSGLRLQELLSRLLLRVSEEHKSALVEVFKSFGDEKISLVDYISSLKAIVGLNNLVEAVGIGTGKQDLTCVGLDTQRSTQTGPGRPEIPTGKACSSLTANEIIKFLSGDYRLSKARSNDLFWEAVWPRLLARGWHSEQPGNQGYNSNINDCLVFLVPGIKKFSRRKLVKGGDYFDSVTEILSKVAKEPGLIELDNEEFDGNENKEDHVLSINVKKLEEDEDDLPMKERVSYLQPRKTGHGKDVIKFTVVDTSSCDGKIRDLRTLPSGTPNSFLISPNRIEGGGKDTRDSQNTFPIDHHISKKPRPVTKKKDSVNGDKKLRKSASSRKQKRGNLDCVPPVSKRCKRLTADIPRETGPTLENGIPSCFSGFEEFNEEKLSRLISCHQDELSSAEKAQSEPLVILNFPQVPRELKLDKLSTKPHRVLVQEGSDHNQRRHSSRNHNPTMRALEAVANGYLTINRRKKARAGPTLHENPPSRKHIGDEEGGVCNSGDVDTLVKFQAKPETEKLLDL